MRGYSQNGFPKPTEKNSKKWKKYRIGARLPRTFGKMTENREYLQNGGLWGVPPKITNVGLGELHNCGEHRFPKKKIEG